eukprot:CAMPEP_0115256740 /NCGR_PEP_ID=MMETSP0270-20121206/46407_1 /TAXON_ID=71861 /ORGANISM="Scrippsiella trochoidea, Strain CCMP3099" /LENGTH=108 /DNA_ID=CAMNT_0002672413 /DNA_START=80 /DNA_END=406 /DNA_ORIENTATION=-
MEKPHQENLPQYKTLQRVQKSYLVRCGEPLENIIPGNGVRPASMIRRIEAEIKRLRGRMGELTEEEILSQVDRAGQKRFAQHDLDSTREALAERVKQLEQRLVELDIL